ncbi:unnamed protein product [Rotaria magnacalcarata]|uniref:Gametogenetin-binding protein 2 n=2 Tax=Rotaria magnacalcarata TaxID=392030 RepID=A0A816ZRT5_9BILA|nr:unnamed protein product [Rotaria magnacalcarata]
MRCCNLHNRTSRSEPITKLIAICQKEKSVFDKCQIPININENLIMKLQFDDSCIRDMDQNVNKKSKTYDTFIKTYKKFNADELQGILSTSVRQIKDYVLLCVPCIGCRTSIDSFIKTLINYRHQALEPLIIDEKGSFAMKSCYISYPDYIYTLFYIHASKLNSFIGSISKSKKNRRCNLHSLDKTKFIIDWELVWNSMDSECRNQVTLVKAHSLLDTLENYLYKHRFCAECKLKVLEAYHFLFNSHDNRYRIRKGFSPALYEGLRSCNNDEHIHIQADKDFVSNLISRAQSEIQEGDHERHARTLEIAQEEILICIGINLFEKFDTIYRLVRAEEQTWQLLFYISIDYLRLNFERSMFGKQDFNTTLNTLCKEFDVTNEMNIHRKQKRQNKKSRRQIKTNEEKDINIINKVDDNDNKDDKLQIHRRTIGSCSCLCQSCNEQSDVSSTIHRNELSKSQSCSSPISSTVEYSSRHTSSEYKISQSSSNETLLSSVSTQDCVSRETNLDKEPKSIGDECLISPSISSIRCSSARTDLGYSSEQDDTCSSTACDACLTDVLHCCPLHRVDENSTEKLSLTNGIDSNHCCVSKTVADSTKTIELCDITRKHKLKLQLCDQYPFFNMDLKQTWDETIPASIENSTFISDDDFQEFLLCNNRLEMRRAQLREDFKLKFQIWQQQTILKFSFKNWCK